MIRKSFIRETVSSKEKKLTPEQEELMWWEHHKKMRIAEENGTLPIQERH